MPVGTTRVSSMPERTVAEFWAETFVNKLGTNTTALNTASHVFLRFIQPPSCVYLSDARIILHLRGKQESKYWANALSPSPFVVLGAGGLDILQIFFQLPTLANQCFA